MSDMKTSFYRFSWNAFLMYGMKLPSCVTLKYPAKCDFVPVVQLIFMHFTATTPLPQHLMLHHTQYMFVRHFHFILSCLHSVEHVNDKKIRLCNVAVRLHALDRVPFLVFSAFLSFIFHTGTTNSLSFLRTRN